MWTQDECISSVNSLHTVGEYVSQVAYNFLILVPVRALKWAAFSACELQTSDLMMLSIISVFRILATGLPCRTWDIYSTTYSLSKGQHNLKFTFIHPNKKSMDFALLLIVVGRLGSQNVSQHSHCCCDILLDHHSLIYFRSDVTSELYARNKNIHLFRPWFHIFCWLLSEINVCNGLDDRVTYCTFPLSLKLLDSCK